MRSKLVVETTPYLVQRFACPLKAALQLRPAQRTQISSFELKSLVSVDSTGNSSRNPF